MSTPTTPRTATVTLPSDRTIHIERIFDASRERVWRAMTDPQLLAQWWGRGNRLDIETLELKPGGHWRFVEHTDHGSFGFEGRYREVTPPERMVMTFEFDGMPGRPAVNSVTLIDLGDGRTKLVAETMFMLAEERDGMMQSGMEGGMNLSYQALDRVLAAMA